MTDEYSEEEKDMIRAQLREGSRVALEVAIKHGARIHPRVERIKSTVKRWLENQEVKAAIHRKPQ